MKKIFADTKQTSVMNNFRQILSTSTHKYGFFEIKENLGHRHDEDRKYFAICDEESVVKKDDVDKTLWKKSCNSFITMFFQENQNKVYRFKVKKDTYELCCTQNKNLELIMLKFEVLGIHYLELLIEPFMQSPTFFRWLNNDFNSSVNNNQTTQPTIPERIEKLKIKIQNLEQELENNKVTLKELEE